MSAKLDELLFLIRQHDAFHELLTVVEAPGTPAYRPAMGDVEKQYAEWIFRSGRRMQHAIWRSFLIGESPDGGKEGPQQQEKS